MNQASVMHSHRSLDAWKVAHQLSLKVLQKTDDHYHPRARSLFDQLRRASVSVEANIVEGYALQTKAQFRRHLRIALGSGAETECFLELVAAREYLPKDVVTELRDLTARSMALVYGLLRFLGRT